MPTIIKPNLDFKKSRRLIDSSIGSRPNSARIKEEEKVNINKLNISNLENNEIIKENLIIEPPTSRSSNLLIFLNLLQNFNYDEKILINLLENLKEWENDSIFLIDFRIYHLLTSILFDLIIKFNEDQSKLLFLTLLICIRIIPSSDHEPLEIIIKKLYFFSKFEENDLIFLNYNIIPSLINLSFKNLNDISLYSSGILRNISNNELICKEIINNLILKLICETLQTKTRIKRFNNINKYFYYQIIGLLHNLIINLKDYSFIDRYPLPLYLLDLTLIFHQDIYIIKIIIKTLNLLLLNEKCIELFETDNFLIFFKLFLINDNEILDNLSNALANVLQIIPTISNNIILLNYPSGIHLLCNILKNNYSNNIKLSMLRCLSIITTFKTGVELTIIYLSLFFPFLNIYLNDLETWSIEQMIVANTLIILRNISIYYPKEVSIGLEGKMNQLMHYGIIDYVISLMRILIQNEFGKKICLEIKEFEEIKLFFPFLDF